MKDRLPPMSTDVMTNLFGIQSDPVLCFIKRTHTIYKHILFEMRVCRIHQDGSHIYDLPSNYIENITHWAELPDPPEDV
mgnify:CR=1 FL=1